jgi:hypothetical protein
MNAKIPSIPPERRLFCNRTLNMRSIRAVGFDMDYTLVHYHVREWEERAYEDARARLKTLGLDVEELRFDHELVRPGLVLDLEHGNAVKPNRFGFVKQACHGTALLGIEQQRDRYSREIIDLSEPRWVFLDTWFAMSEACLYLQLVDRMDAGRIPGIKSYTELYRRVYALPHGGRAQAAHRAKSGALRRPRPRATAGIARPQTRGQEAAAHHQQRMVVHERHAAARARSLPSSRHDLPAALRHHHRRRAQAPLL